MEEFSSKSLLRLKRDRWSQEGQGYGLPLSLSGESIPGRKKSFQSVIHLLIYFMEQSSLEFEENL